MKNNLKISNIILSGRLPFKRKMKEVEIKNLIMRSKRYWQLINEEISPILQTKIEKDGITRQRKKRTASISVWASGAINIVGIQSLEEGDDCWKLVIKELNKYCKGLI